MGFPPWFCARLSEQDPEGLPSVEGPPSSLLPWGFLAFGKTTISQQEDVLDHLPSKPFLERILLVGKK
jgi:hypothetical protein